jgi:uncharacterized metal-binding protein
MARNSTNPERSRLDADFGIEMIHIPKKPRVPGSVTSRKRFSNRSTAIFTCESSCVRSDIAKLVAEAVCRRLPGERMRRVEIGDVASKNRGTPVRRFASATVLEGCGIQCASRMLRDSLSNIDMEVLPVDQFYKFEGNPFSINNIKPSTLAKIIERAVEGVLAALKHDEG